MTGLIFIYLYCTVLYLCGTHRVLVFIFYLLLIYFFQSINIKLCYIQLPINASAATTSPAVVGHASADIRTTTTSTGIVQAVRARGFNTIGVSSTGVDFAAGGPRWAGWHVAALNSVVLNRHISQTSFDLFSIGLHDLCCIQPLHHFGWVACMTEVGHNVIRNVCCVFGSSAKSEILDRVAFKKCGASQIVASQSTNVSLVWSAGSPPS